MFERMIEKVRVALEAMGTHKLSRGRVTEQKPTRVEWVERPLDDSDSVVVVPAAVVYTTARDELGAILRSANGLTEQMAAIDAALEKGAAP